MLAWRSAFLPLAAATALACSTGLLAIAGGQSPVAPEEISGAAADEPAGWSNNAKTMLRATKGRVQRWFRSLRTRPETETMIEAGHAEESGPPAGEPTPVPVPEAHAKEVIVHEPVGPVVPIHKSPRTLSSFFKGKFKKKPYVIRRSLRYVAGGAASRIDVREFYPNLDCEANPEHGSAWINDLTRFALAESDLQVAAQSPNEPPKDSATDPAKSTSVPGVESSTAATADSPATAGPNMIALPLPQPQGVSVQVADDPPKPAAATMLPPLPSRASQTIGVPPTPPSVKTRPVAKRATEARERTAPRKADPASDGILARLREKAASTPTLVKTQRVAKTQPVAERATEANERTAPRKADPASDGILARLREKAASTPTLFEVAEPATGFGKGAAAPAERQRPAPQPMVAPWSKAPNYAHVRGQDYATPRTSWRRFVAPTAKSARRRRDSARPWWKFWGRKQKAASETLAAQSTRQAAGAVAPGQADKPLPTRAWQKVYQRMSPPAADAKNATGSLSATGMERSAAPDQAGKPLPTSSWPKVYQQMSPPARDGKGAPKPRSASGPPIIPAGGQSAAAGANPIARYPVRAMPPRKPTYRNYVPQPPAKLQYAPTDALDRLRAASEANGVADKPGSRAIAIPVAGSDSGSRKVSRDDKSTDPVSSRTGHGEQDAQMASGPVLLPLDPPEDREDSD